MKDYGWDDLRVFYHVAQSGGLSGAARALGISSPTVGRKMQALEEAAGQALFVRSQTGYGLTPAGSALFERVRAMQAAAVPAEAFLGAAAEAPVVRLTCGSGTAMFLADRYFDLSRPGDDFRLSFSTTEAVVDMEHRGAELAIRNQPAQGNNLASRSLGPLAFAPFCSVRQPQREALSWVAMEPARATYPAARWVHDSGHRVGVVAGSVSTLYQLVRAGAGIGVMPCMIGDCDPALVRAGEAIDALEGRQHLVMHNDERNRGPVRRVIERVVRVYEANADLLSGQRPMRG